MRRLTTLIWMLLAVSSSAIAQSDRIGVYQDIAGTDCNIVDDSSNFVTVYVVHTSSGGATASSFSAPAPGCFTGTWLSDTFVFPINIGDSQNGVMINYGSCQTGTFHVLTINYYAPGVTPDCCPYSVIAHDGSIPPIVEVADCSFNTILGVGETSQINKTAACECCPGGTIYVPPYPNIQTAIDAACSGDTVVLADSTYTGTGNRDIVISGKTVTLKSAGGDPANCVISVQGSAADEHSGFLITGDVVIEGIRVDKSHHSSKATIFCSGYPSHNSSLVLRDCWIVQNENQSVAYRTDLVVENCRFEENGEGGLLVGLGTRAEIVGCEFTYNDGFGLRISGAELVQVNNSSSTDNSGDGIYCTATDTLVVRNSSIIGNHDDGVDVEQAILVMDSCAISANTGVGVQGLECPMDLTNCLIANNQSLGMRLGASNTVLDGCTIYGNSGFIIRCQTPTASSIELYNCNLAFNPAIRTVESCTISNVECTNVYGNTGGDWDDDLALWEGLNNNISEDPDFCAPAENDFHLEPQSPCLAVCGLMGAFDGGCNGTAIETPQTPARFALHQNVPNPFNPTTTIYFDVPTDGGQITIKVYDVGGRLVRTLVDGMQTAGEKSVTWNGRTDKGEHVASGVYFCKLKAPGFAQTRKMVLIQ